MLGRRKDHLIKMIKMCLFHKHIIFWGDRVGVGKQELKKITKKVSQKKNNSQEEEEMQPVSFSLRL